MKVAEYRDLTSRMYSYTNDWHACVNDFEKNAWFKRASVFYEEFKRAECLRATSHDLHSHNSVAERFEEIIARHFSSAKRAAQPLKDGDLDTILAISGAENFDAGGVKGRIFLEGDFAICVIESLDIDEAAKAFYRGAKIRLERQDKLELWVGDKYVDGSKVRRLMHIAASKYLAIHPRQVSILFH